MSQLSQRSLFLYFSLNEIKVILPLYQLILPYHENLPLKESSQVEIHVLDGFAMKISP